MQYANLFKPREKTTYSNSNHGITANLATLRSRSPSDMSIHAQTRWPTTTSGAVTDPSVREEPRTGQAHLDEHMRSTF